MRSECRMRLAAAFAVGILACTPSWAQGASADADRAFADGRYAVALTLYQQRAVEGDAAAAELAGQMYYYGATVYGDEVRRDLARARSLLVQAAEAGRPLANYLARQLEREASSSSVGSDEGYVPGPHGC